MAPPLVVGIILSLPLLLKGLRHLLSIFYLDFYFPFSTWTFISPFLFGLLFPFSIWTFISFFDFYFFFFYFYFPFCTNRDLILDFFQVFIVGVNSVLLRQITSLSIDSVSLIPKHSHSKPRNFF